MHFISKILRDTIDDSVHRAFLRYGKGEYAGPAAQVAITRTGKVKVRSTYLYQDLVASVFLKLMPIDTISISGVVLGYALLDEELSVLGIDAEPFKKKPRTQLYQSKITGEYSVNKVALLYDDIGENAYIFCNLTANQGWVHKSKTKIPSAQKEALIEERIKFSSTNIPAGTEFVTLLLQELTPDFLNDIPSKFTSLRIENTYQIQDLVFPSNKDKLTSKEIRLKTKRSGILHRKLIVDDSEFINKHIMMV